MYLQYLRILRFDKLNGKLTVYMWELPPTLTHHQQKTKHTTNTSTPPIENKTHHEHEHTTHRKQNTPRTRTHHPLKTKHTTNTNTPPIENKTHHEHEHTTHRKQNTPRTRTYHPQKRNLSYLVSQLNSFMTEVTIIQKPVH